MRFADELSDCELRVNSIDYDLNIKETKSLIYWDYSKSIKKDSVVIEPHSILSNLLVQNSNTNKITITHHVELDKAFNLYEHIKYKEITLFDFLFVRMIKLYNEMIYCSKYFIDLVDIDTLVTNIHFTNGERPRPIHSISGILLSKYDYNKDIKKESLFDKYNLNPKKIEADLKKEGQQ